MTKLPVITKEYVLEAYRSRGLVNDEHPLPPIPVKKRKINII